MIGVKNYFFPLTVCINIQLISNRITLCNFTAENRKHGSVSSRMSSSVPWCNIRDQPVLFWHNRNDSEKVREQLVHCWISEGGGDRSVYLSEQEKRWWQGLTLPYKNHLYRSTYNVSRNHNNHTQANRFSLQKKKRTVRWHLYEEEFSQLH